MIELESRKTKSYNVGLDQARLAEGVNAQIGMVSVEDNLRAELTERTGAVNYFELAVGGSRVTARGYEQRGDISNSFKKSVQAAIDAKVAKRFQLENTGFERVKGALFRLPLYSTVALFSPFPKEKMEGYPGYSLAYFYHILPGERAGEKVVKALSYINRFTPQEQAEILNRLMMRNEVAPTEESILKSPVGVYGVDRDTSSFRQIWQEIGRVYEKKEDREFAHPSFDAVEQYLLHGEAIWKEKHPELSRMMEEVAVYIANRVPFEEWRDKWRIMLNFADKELLHVDLSTILAKVNTNDQVSFVYDLVFEHYSHLSHVPRAVATSCGESGDINPFANPVSELLAKAQIISGTFSITALTKQPSFLQLTDDLGSREVPCSCGHVNIRPYNDVIPACENCSKNLKC